MEMVAFLVQFPLFMFAVTLHEVSHGWVALRLGDATARMAGRLTLNPLKHIDPVGTLILPIFLLWVHSPFVIGWAKPVPINPLNLRRPKQDMFWVGAAGPVSNFSFALVVSLLVRAFGGALPPLVTSMAIYLITINLLLGTFNLLPIPPLDGSRVLVGILPPEPARFLLRLERWGILLMVLLLSTGFIDRVIWPVVAMLGRVLGL
ncbi:MAG: site-2 protease family protein [Candidatus Omnitrophica bacterium]|nr:site-2 protease family protein [Candidatus Omnitrophota bacterium]